MSVALALVPVRFRMFPEIHQGVGVIFKWGGGGREALLPENYLPKFKFLSGVRPLNFENTYAKQNKIFEIFSRAFSAMLPPPALKVKGATPLPFPSAPCFHAYGSRELKAKERVRSHL